MSSFIRYWLNRSQQLCRISSSLSAADLPFCSVLYTMNLLYIVMTFELKCTVVKAKLNITGYNKYDIAIFNYMYNV